MTKLITRREALKTIAATSAGAVLASPVISSCKSSSKVSPTVVKATGGGEMTARYWESLGDTVSALGLGCMRFPKLEGTDILDQEQVNDMVDYALANGVNYFDTAPYYSDGQSEIVLGNAIKRHPRESFLLATKMSSHNFMEGGNEDMPADEVYKKSVALFEQSCERLYTDYFDYYLLHCIGTGTGMPFFERRFIESGVLDYLVEKRNKGVIRHLGFSFHGNYRVFDHLMSLHDTVHWDFVQIQMNYLDWTYNTRKGTQDNSKYLYDELVKRNIPVVVMEPIRGGALAKVNDGLRARMAEIRPELSPAGLALNYVASHPAVLTTLSGMSNMDQLVENINTFSPLNTLSDEEQSLMENEIARLYGENPTIGCTACDYCMPCPYGIDIPGNFRVYDACTSQLLLPNPNGVHDKEFFRKRRIFLNRYKNSLDEKQRAEFCINCKQCVPKCPQGINIPNRLQRIEDLVSNLKAIIPI